VSLAPGRSSSPDRLTARERLLAAADELFYEQGVHSVGIDKVIERAGVAKASLYNTFGSKDELVRAYLEGRHERRQARVLREIAQHDVPRDRVLAVFDAMIAITELPGFRGCAFLNASAEAVPGSSVEEVSAVARDWIRSTFATLAAEAGARDPAALAQQLVLLYDGASVTAQLDHRRDAALTARAAAAVLLEAALVPGTATPADTTGSS
jgi:AcrR family transcriptional regulator